MSFGLRWKVWRASVASARELSGVNWREEADAVPSPTEQSPKKRKRKTKKLLMIVDMNRPVLVKSKIESVKKSND
jgi:hypothetical protein